MDASNDNTPNAEDLAAILNFRETLLAQNWPDAEAVERILGGRTDACAEFNANRQRGWEGCRIFGVWAGRDRGGYRYPLFQFLEGGLVHPKLPELMDALAHRPDLRPDHDKSGWERAFWLYQPRGRLSVQALALRAAQFDEVREDPERFAALPKGSRTPAEVFPDDAQAVIDLAMEDAKQLYRPTVGKT